MLFPLLDITLQRPGHAKVLTTLSLSTSGSKPYRVSGVGVIKVRGDLHADGAGSKGCRTIHDHTKHGVEPKACTRAGVMV